jgi:hypothetical protein
MECLSLFSKECGQRPKLLVKNRAFLLILTQNSLKLLKMGKGGHRHHHGPRHHHRRGPGVGVGLLVGGAIGYGIARRGHRRRGIVIFFYVCRLGSLFVF